MIASPALLRAAPAPLRELYDWRNGFRALDDALLVLPLEAAGSVPGALEWNAPDGWRRWYDASSSSFFFAMDVTLGQFGVTRGGAVVRLDAESGDLSTFARSVDAWADKVIAGGARQLVAREWKRQHRALFLAERLVSPVPGGNVAMLRAVDLRDGIEALGSRLGREVEHEEHSGEHFVADLCSMAW